MKNNTNCLKDVKLNKDPKRGYSLCVTYQKADEHGNIHEIVIDGVPLLLFPDSNYINAKTDVCAYDILERPIDIGYGMVHMPDDVKFMDRIVKYATKEMTLEEIEKKLGHKVKIVSGEEK